MKNFYSSLLLCLLLQAVTYSLPKPDYNFNTHSPIIFAQVPLEMNNIRAFIWNTGILDQDLSINNHPGFYWPIGTQKTAIFTAGLTVAAYYNNALRMAAASFRGEYIPGYCVNGVLFTNNNFKLYSIKRGDNQNTNPDWTNWGLMIPYGAPWRDGNNNGIYEPAIDTPGVRYAAQTVFICLTDADPSAHTTSEGFGGGTLPLGAEVHATFWCYDNPGYGDMQFMKWVVINKNTVAWDSAIVSIVCDPDLGDAGDDYIGCDTTLNLGICYNSDNTDGNGTGQTYGPNPPASGIQFLTCGSSFSKLTSFDFFTNSSGPLCERDPSTTEEAYWFMKGFKKDGTPWRHVPSQQPTKFCYPGEPETSQGWLEYTGSFNGCGGLVGNLTAPNPPGDRRFVMNFKPVSNRMNPGDSNVVIACQLVARGINNKNSVTVLKQLALLAQRLCDSGFVIGITPISTEIPKEFSLEQNYPNPFNPTTNIQFSIPVGTGRDLSVQLKVYDALGREVSNLVNENLKAGIYKVDWDGSNFASGIYFYKLNVMLSGVEAFSQTKRMVLLK